MWIVTSFSDYETSAEVFDNYEIALADYFEKQKHWEQVYLSEVKEKYIVWYRYTVNKL